MQSDATTRVEFRCWQCGRLLGVLIAPRGQIERRCRRCRSYAVWTGDPVNDCRLSERHTREARPWYSTRETEVRCKGCASLLGFADLSEGRVEFKCDLCKRIVVATPVAPEPPRPQYTPESIVALMEERWQVFIKEQSRRRAELAVGLRFDVFKRDGFRCRYCGISADDGAILHADHVVPESKGGPTTLENLVTACLPCNLGKSDKVLDAAISPQNS